ncbi:MAG: tRNA1(Val) (adenine(37)-N6)-methyltransferase [Saprospiraceae bacterium]
MREPFQFKRFLVEQHAGVFPVGTDGILLGAWAETDDAINVLDIGTGTGLLALMLAQRLEAAPSARVRAVDLLPESCVCARHNFARSPWADRLELFEQSVQSFAENTARQYDLIVSNPPFFSGTTTSPDERRSFSRNDVALDSSDLVDSVRRLLLPNGRFCAVLPIREGQLFLESAALTGLYCTRMTHVRSRLDKPVERLLLQLEPDPYRFERTELIIQAPGGGPSTDFRALTEAFYLD